MKRHRLLALGVLIGGPALAPLFEENAAAREQPHRAQDVPCSTARIASSRDLHDAIESIHRQLRKIIKTRGQFPSDDAASKLIWLALRNITADWGRAAKEWREAMNQFAIAYGDRFARTSA